MTSFAKQLYCALEDRNMSQKQLSEMTGISKASVSQYLSGKNVPGLEKINLIAKAVDVPLERLMGYHVDSESKKSKSRKIKIKDAARCMGKSEQFVRVGLRRGILPFGVAIQSEGSKWNYFIRPDEFRAFVGESLFREYFGQQKEGAE